MRRVYVYAIVRALILAVGLFVASEIVLNVGRNIPLQLVSAAIAIGTYLFVNFLRTRQLREFSSNPIVRKRGYRLAIWMLVFGIPIALYAVFVASRIGITLQSVFIAAYAFLAITYLIAEIPLLLIRYDDKRLAQLLKQST